jgi:hypothetical protein
MLARWLGAQKLVHAGVPRRPLRPRSSTVWLLFAVVSFEGTTNFGLVAEPLAVPDPEFLAEVGRELRS